MLKRMSTSVAVAVMVLLLAACTPNLDALKGAVDAFAPLVEHEIAAGRISADRAALYTRDAKVVIDAFGVLSNEWAAAKTKLDRVSAIQKFANATAAVALDFAKVPQLSEAMMILNATLAVLQAFYGGGSAPAAQPNMPKSERELNRYLKEQSAKLKLALQPH